MTGKTIDHYRILEKLGEGGMGVVYRALDTHLDRPVAIKILPAEAMANPERKKRFVQEAKSASALNHPNIITIYDIDASDGVDFIAMEYVAGKTLDRLFGRHGLPLNEALKYAVQAADALATAHAAGIVHRDLKPANIMVTEKGQVKVLDFGLAKLTETGESEELGATLSLRPEAPHTEEGSIVGTVTYMSPEQAEGKKVDARSDIFTFGSVLYEMVTGQRAFQGDTKLATLSAILRQDPKPMAELLEGVPRELETVVARCLRKDPNRRFQHMDDVKIALEELKEQSDSGQTPLVTAPRKRTPWTMIAAGAAVVVVAAAGVAWWAGRSGAPKPSQGPVLTRLTSDAGLTTDPTFWPAGNLLAYASDRGSSGGPGGNLDIWVQQLSGGEPHRLTTNPADDHEPAFSPDGSKIAFRSEREGGGIYVVATLGGAERKIADRGRRPRFSPDGQWIAYWDGEPAAPSDYPGKVYIAPAAGGSPQQLPPDFTSARDPIWSTDGRYLLFAGSRDAGSPYDWWVAPVAGGSAVKTGARDFFAKQRLVVEGPAAWVGDQVFFSARVGDATNIWQIGISPRTLQVTGPPRRVTAGTETEAAPVVAGGRILFASIRENVDIWSLPIDPNKAQVLGEPQRLTEDIAPDIQPDITRDGKKMVFSSHRSGNWDVWLKDLETGREAALTATPADELNPRIAADGSRVAYRVPQQDGTSSTYVMPVGGVAQKICDRCGVFPWSPDGLRLLFSGDVGGIGVVDASTGEKTLLFRDPSKARIAAPSFSSDGRWLTFYTGPSPGRTRVYIAPYTGREIPQEQWISVTDGSAWDTVPRFSPDGALLYFFSQRDGSRCLWAERIDAATKKPTDAPFAVHHFHSARRSPIYVRSGQVAIDVARDKVVITIDERVGNIWMAQLEAQ